jgi:hypothetical protein
METDLSATESMIVKVQKDQILMDRNSGSMNSINGSLKSIEVVVG